MLRLPQNEQLKVLKMLCLPRNHYVKALPEQNSQKEREKKSFKKSPALGAPGLTTRNKKLLETKGIATNGARTLLGAPGLTTRNKKLLGTKGIATMSKDATSGSWPYY